MEGRFHGLDALRGLAALVVLVAHLKTAVAPAGGFMAVDIFFLLSGFVIARTYEPRYRAGMSLAEFVRRRLIRLYPMYFVGAALAIYLGCGWYTFFFLPTPGNEILFVGNPALWSLPLELVASVAFYAFCIGLSTRWLLALALLFGGTALFLMAYTGVLNPGPTWPTALQSLPRIAFAFLLGAVISRTFGERKLSQWSWTVLVATYVFMMVAGVKLSTNIAFVFVMAPLIVVYLAKYEIVDGGWLAKWLGNISYPLYAIHHSIVLMLLPYWNPVAIVLLCIVLAHLAAHYCDAPARRALGTLWKESKPRRNVHAASKQADA